MCVYTESAPFHGKPSKRSRSRELTQKCSLRLSFRLSTVLHRVPPLVVAPIASASVAIYPWPQDALESCGII